MNIDRNDLLVKPTSNKREYYSRKEKGEKSTNVHWGQFKLLFNELAFFNYFYDMTIENPIVVYIGAAPGIHIRPIVQLFPNIIKWYLYDPRDFELKLTGIEDKVEIHQEFFTDDTANQFSKYNNVFFISDIRTADHTKLSAEDNELAIIKDNENQMKWVQIIKPIKAHLKFRLPYPTAYPSQYIEYYDGVIMFQPWAPVSSTETRLILDALAKKITYDIKEYEQILFYHNTIVREKNKYKLNGFMFENINKDSDLLNDFDSMISLQILADYMNKLNREYDINSLIGFYEWILNEVNYERKYKLTISIKRELSTTTDNKRIKELNKMFGVEKDNE